MKLLKEIVFGGLFIFGILLCGSEPSDMNFTPNFIGLLCFCGACWVARRIE